MSDSSDLIMKYQEQAINTMSRGELIIRLYDELIKNLKYASIFFKKKNTAAAQKCTGKCRSILNYLIVILDRKYELSQTLERLYTYMVGQIIQVNVSGDASVLDKIVPKVEELRDTWAQAEKKLRSQPGEKAAGRKT